MERLFGIGQLAKLLKRMGAFLPIVLSYLVQTKRGVVMGVSSLLTQATGAILVILRCREFMSCLIGVLLRKCLIYLVKSSTQNAIRP